MNNNKQGSSRESGLDDAFDKDHRPFYNPGIGNESGINFQNVEIKSHSFSVRSTTHLASENIIFEPGNENEES